MKLYTYVRMEASATYVSRVPLLAKMVSGGHFFWHLHGPLSKVERCKQIEVNDPEIKTKGHISVQRMQNEVWFPSRGLVLWVVTNTR